MNGALETETQPEPFRILRIGADRVQEILGAPNLPHRHAYQELILVMRGEVRHQLDDILERIPSPAVMIIPQLRVHQLVPSGDFEGAAIRFQEEFLPQGLPLLFGGAVPLLHCHLDPIRFSQMQKLLDVLEAEPHHANTLRWILLGLLNLLQEWQPHSHVAWEQGLQDADLQLWHILEKTIDRHFASAMPVREYAEILNSKEKVVNQLAKRFSGKTVGELIDWRRILEAKRKLLFGSENLKEIAFAVGYEDHSYFSRVFKKTTGHTPSEYRAQQSHGSLEGFRIPPSRIERESNP